MLEHDHRRNAKVFKALCDPKRLAILELLRSGEKCACVLNDQLKLCQSAVSYHMKILCESGIVDSHQEGKWTHYSLSETGGKEAAALLLRLTTPHGGQEPGRPENTLIKAAPCENTKTDHIDGGNQTMSEKTQLYVLTGFLGSGKTTILLKLIDALKGKRVGVIQNEFGKLGIDGEILRNDDIQMVEINRGSIFCSCLKLSFVQALTDMAAHHFDYLFVESSGLGDPSNVEEILAASAALCGNSYEFKGAICLVDAVNFFDQLEDLETVYRQLKHCHLAVLTKVDLVEEARLEELERKIREINPICRIDTSANGNLDLSFLNEDLMQYRWAESEDTTNSEETKPKTLFLDFEGEVSEETLKRFLARVEDHLYRAKGFFRLSGKGWNQIDLVGRKIDVKPCPAKELSQMVFISKIGPQIIREIMPAWEETVGQPMKLRN